VSNQRERGETARRARRIRNVLFAAQSLGSAAFLVASTVNAIAGAKLGGSAAWAGAPSAIYQAGQAMAAFLWGRLMDPLGRRGTLSAGLLVGALGAGVASRSVTALSLGPFLVGLLLMGFAQSAMQLGRFVSAEVHPLSERGRAISFVVMGGTVGAVSGPLFVGPAGSWAATRGLGELAGPYAASVVLLTLAAMALYAGLRPEPRELARAFAADQGGAAANDEPRPLRQILEDRPAVLAMVSMIVGQVVMVMLMVMTSLHMTGHDHSLGNVSIVISSHVLGMYAVSAFSGRLTDLWGRIPVIATGASVLFASGLTAPLSPRLVPLGLSLFALGLGWNLCFVGGSTLLSDRLRPVERARTQGLSDFAMGSSAALGGAGGALVYSAAGYTVIGMLGAALSLVPLLLIWQGGRRPALRPAEIP
jgi:MFS family permease